ncbi:MAG TPA: hypothetical protein VH598_02450, partial [Verrucomicrobiae bacterium]|nr:hypothetical protein [Verrucomicrobiae bacterium]
MQQVASAEPGVNFTGGRLDAAPRDTRTDLPVDQPPIPDVSQRFVPNRYQDHTMWSKPHPPIEAISNYPGIVYTSQMPSPEEAPGVLSGSTRQLANWGAPSVQGPARIASNLAGNFAGIIGPVLDFYSRGAFRQGYESASAKGLAMQRERLTLDYQRSVMAAHQAYQANEAHLSRYGDIFSALDAHGLNEEQAKQEIRRMALAEPGGVDQVLLTALDNGGLSGVYSLLQSRHAKALDMLSAATTMENVRGRSGKTVKEQGEFDKSLGDGTGTPRESGGGALGPAPASAAGPAPHADEFSNETDAKLGKDHHLSPLGVQAAHDWVSTGKPAGETANAFENDAKQNYANVYAAAGDITKQMNAIASGNDDADTKIEKLRQINPDVASGVDALLKFQSDPSKPENKIFKTWAHKIDKTWEEG